MGSIHKLSPVMADMIAAGEVVERPASVIKELVENSVDAGAAQVLVEIKNGGITFMRVTDNGCGMAPEDAPTAFLRHATSKVSSPEDLNGITTMGFRGEALAAISSVSKIDLLTKSPDAEGVSLHAEAGNILDVSPAGCPSGTTIIIRDLFYNTPARMKFLKRDSVEGSYIAGAVQRQALGHPEIALRFLRDGKLEFMTSGDGSLRSAIYTVLGRQAAKEMTEVQSTSSGITVSGYAGLPSANRGSRSMQYFFVNGRYVKSKMMASALEEAYRNQMMTGRFPICVLHITLPPAAVDVNVHPAKTEVKFLREQDVFDAIHYAVLGAVSRAPDRPEITVPKQKTGGMSAMTAQEYRNQASQAAAPTTALMKTLSARSERPDSGTLRVQDSVRLVPGITGSVPAAPAAAEVSKPIPSSSGRSGKVPAVSSLDELPQVSTHSAVPAVSTKQTAAGPAPAPYRIIGQTMNTYILVEQDDQLLIFDKHAAHERILFEKLREEPHEILSQMLLHPIEAMLPQEDSAVLLEQAALLQQLGFTVEDFGGGALLIRAIPSDIDEQDAEACLAEMAQALQDGRRLDPSAVHDNLLHTIACKAAIKGGRKSEPEEISALVDELMRRDDIRHCPHGRPVCITFSRSHLDRQFKRS